MGIFLNECLNEIYPFELYDKYFYIQVNETHLVILEMGRSKFAYWEGVRVIPSK